MSFFYLTAVKGDIPVHLLEEITVGRLRYLKSVLKNDKYVYNEYLIEGSIYDNIGHFVLCVVAIMTDDMEFRKFFKKTERDLFVRRLSALSGYDLRCFAKRLLRSIKKQPKTPTYIDALKILCEHFVLKDLAQHICSETHTHECSIHHIKLHFKHCLPLIAKRQVELQNGIALIPCGKWKHYLTVLFCTHLNFRLCNTTLNALKMDPRVMELIGKIKLDLEFLKSNNFGNNVLLSKSVDAASLLFPPCMLNLHQHLRKRHRLSHIQRFHYSLFLKDIGMPIEEAIDFWKQEYQQAPNGSHSCCHNWEKDEKKYLYGIRHMYGLEGCRKNYASVNCQRIQSIDSSCSEGGCPFKILETSRMNQVLDLPCNDSRTAQINVKLRRHNYTSACMLYLKTKHCDAEFNCDIESSSFNFTPVKYYSYVVQNKNL